MSDKRKRQIIQGKGPEGPKEPPVHEGAPESFGDGLNLPGPLIFLGFMTIIYLSITLTYVVEEWPAPPLNLAENKRIAVLEDMTALEAAVPISRDINRVVAVNAPIADLSGGQANRRFARSIPAITPGARVPENRGSQSLVEALKVTDPAAILTLPLRSPIEVADRNETPPQKLMQQRLANAVPPPELMDGNNPLERSVIGEITEASRPTLTETIDSGNPVAVLTLPPGNIPDAIPSADVPGQKLMRQRFANAVPPPRLAPPPIDVAPDILPPEGGIDPDPDSWAEANKPWRRFAAAVPPNVEGKGQIVIVIDDMGNNSAMASAFSQLDGPLNFAFLPYAPNLGRQTALMRSQGHELLVHMPMEPTGNENPGPRALLTSLSREELGEAIDWNLSRFNGFVGVNNHMGSRFTKDRDGMEQVMQALQDRGLLFLDSRTVANSEGARLAESMGLPWAGRDVFLDNEINDAAILRQLLQVERLAKTRGQVIAIGHPYGATLRVLRDWIPTLEGKGLVLVPLSSVVTFEANPQLAELQGQ